METYFVCRMGSMRIKRFVALGVSLLSIAACAPLFAAIVPPQPAASTAFVPGRASGPVGVVLAGASSASASDGPSGFTRPGSPPLDIDNIDPDGNVTRFLYSPLTGVMPSSAFLIDRGAALAFRVIPPAAPLPEPTTMIAGALLLLPFGVNAIRFLRKHRGVVAADVSPRALK